MSSSRLHYISISHFGLMKTFQNYEYVCEEKDFFSYFTRFQARRLCEPLQQRDIDLFDHFNLWSCCPRFLTLAYLKRRLLGQVISEAAELWTHSDPTFLIIRPRTYQLPRNILSLFTSTAALLD